MSILVRFHSIGGPEVLYLDDVDAARPQAGEVRIRTRALGLNRADVMFRTGNHFVRPQLPQAIGLEAAGTIESIGAGVVGLTVGDAVSVVPAFGLTDYALHGELVVAPAQAVIKHPENLSPVEAAALWMSFVTAYGGLVDIAGLGRGDSVAITAASSATGLAAIQIANMVGARPIALTRTGAKSQRLLDAGASAIVATENEDVTASLLRITDGTGVHVIFDPIGGPQLNRLIDAAASSATVIVYGALSSDPIPMAALTLLEKRLTVRGYDMQEVARDPDRLEKAVAFIREGIEKGSLTPTVDAVFALSDIADAYTHLESNDHVGKIVVTVP